MVRLLIFTPLGLLLTVSSAMAQEHMASGNDKVIRNVITELFDAYRAADSARVAAVFTKDARLQTIQTIQENHDVISEPSSIQSFLAYIGHGLSEVHDERIWDTEIYFDDKLVTVSTKYAFFLGPNFIHCGTETFLLRKKNDDWKIFYLVDTRQLNNCDLPVEFK